MTPSNPFKTKVSDIGHGAIGFDVFLLGFGLALVNYFLTMPPFLSFVMGMYTVCYYAYM